ncbi:hypothetical protein [Legionella fairfieldensis]|uniref:hypothetical protein n=1 Tax=Legionella fairfieldensis TaxID=45064 RepID=UPI001040E1F3|nr:hypothetical protein [Legionella fairfieldensis]
MTYKEKREIEDIFSKYMGMIIGVTSGCSMAMYFRPKIGCFAFVLGSIALILKLKVDMKKIIGDRKKISCPKESFFLIFEKEAQNASWRYIFQLVCGVLLFFWGAFYFFSEFISQGKISLFILAFIFFFTSLFTTYTIFILIRHKPKKDQNT